MQISANGISLEVEDHGPPSGEPLLLIMGLGMQLLGWHEGFVATLVQRGFRVVRFDNRDIGLSTSLDSAGLPNLAIESLRFALGMRACAARTRWPTWRPTASVSSTGSASRGPTSAVRRWAA